MNSNDDALFFFFQGNLTKHMKSKSHGKKCQAIGVSESSVEEPESEETGTWWLGGRGWGGGVGEASPIFPIHRGGILVQSWVNCR